MKNTLRFALLGIGILLMGFSSLTWILPQLVEDTLMAEKQQSAAMFIFGLLCLLSGIGYKRRR